MLSFLSLVYCELSSRLWRFWLVSSWIVGLVKHLINRVIYTGPSMAGSGHVQGRVLESPPCQLQERRLCEESEECMYAHTRVIKQNLTLLLCINTNITVFKYDFRSNFTHRIREKRTETQQVEKFNSTWDQYIKTSTFMLSHTIPFKY